MAEAPKSQVFTVIVVSDHSQAVRKFRVPRPWLQKATWGGLGLAGLALVEEEGPEAVERLVDLANDRGGDDNITVAMVRLAEPA